MTLKELIERLSAKIIITILPCTYTIIKGKVIDRDFTDYLKPYMERKVDFITAYQKDEIKVVLIWDEEAEA